MYFSPLHLFGTLSIVSCIFINYLNLIILLCYHSVHNNVEIRIVLLWKIFRFFYLKEANWWENLNLMNIKDKDQMFKKKTAQRRHVVSIPSWKICSYGNKWEWNQWNSLATDYKSVAPTIGHFTNHKLSKSFMRLTMCLAVL